MENNIIQSENEGIDIKKYLFLFLHNWYWFFLTVSIAVAIAYLYNRYSKEVYQLNCTIIVSDETTEGYGVESVLDELSFIRRRQRKAVVENEISILKSYQLARTTLENLDFTITYMGVGRRKIAESVLYHNCPFTVTLDTSLFNSENIPVYITILSEEEYLLKLNSENNYVKKLKFGEKFTHERFNFTINLTNKKDFIYNPHHSNQYYFIINNINGLTNQYKNKINITLNDEKGSIVTLSMQGFVPRKVANYLNTLCNAYIQRNLDEKNQVSVNTITFIDGQLNNIIDSLEAAGIQLQNFRSGHKLINVSQEGQALYEQLEEYQKQMAILSIKANYYDYLLEYIQSGTDLNEVMAPSAIGIDDKLLNSLIDKLIELFLQKKSLQFTVSENNPKIVEIAFQIENIKQSLEENLKNIIQANNMEIKNINQQLNSIEKEIKKFPYTERQLVNIQREFNINDEIYTFLLEKRAEAGIKKASNTPNSKILDAARPENAIRTKPKKQMNYLIALLIGALFPLILILLADYFNNKIMDWKDVENATKVPIIGSVGHNLLDTELPVMEKPKSALAESYRSLRTNLQYLTNKDKGNTITITSTISGEGKSFCAVNLAAIYAMAGRKTLLLSLDLRKPKIHKIFNIDNEKGLSTFLIGKNKPDDIIIPSNIENLSISVTGPVPPNPAELIESKYSSEFFEHIKKKFEYIIVDTPPVAIVSDAQLVSKYADVNIFIIRQNYSNKEILKLINELYDKKIYRNLSILINDVTYPGYYGYYSYQYGYSYRYGYSYGYGQGYYDEEPEKKGVFNSIKKTFRK